MLYDQYLIRVYSIIVSYTDTEHTDDHSQSLFTVMPRKRVLVDSGMKEKPRDRRRAEELRDNGCIIQQ